MRIGALFSGGKDSTYAAYVESRVHELACLITVFPESSMSYMFHYPDLKWTKLQAEALGLPQLVQESPGVKEEELEQLKSALRRSKDEFGIEGVCTGALASVYQKVRVERIAGELGLHCLSPLWGVDPETHLRRLADEGFTSVVVSVSALGLGPEWLGRTLDTEAINELVALGKKNKFHVGLEGGEGETFVVDAPSFSKKVEIRSAKKHWEGDRGFLEITDAVLVSKG